MKMDLQTSKIELAKMILSINNQSIIDKVLQVLKTQKSDFWLELSENERKNIKLGIHQLENGEGIELNDFVKKVS